MATAGTTRPAQADAGAGEAPPQVAAPVAATGAHLPVVRNRGLWTALRYRGREGMWTWILHRLTGLGILLFLIMHVVETATVIYYPAIYDSFLAAYRSALFRFAEVLIIFAVLYHALNGLRIIVQDFWPLVMRHQRQMTWAVAAIVVLTMIPVTWIMVAPLFGWRDEPGTARHHERCLANPDAPACHHAPVTQTGEVSL
jgi:succinate dehydrogenase / fumarate reductase, cytochrome b subunit